MSGLRVLVVDDDEDFARSWGRVIASDGHQVELAFSGEAALAKFEAAHFDVAFLDVKLPGKNGVESLIEIRRLKPAAKVVMMTGYTVDELLDQALEHGAWTVIHKPLDEERVLNMLGELRSGVILVADDDPNFVESLTSLLEDFGYTVVGATSGSEALELLQTMPIDALILDLRMPVLDGLDVYLRMREQGLLVPTIIVTAYAREEVRQLDRLRQLEITGVLVKPFAPEVLLAMISQLTLNSPGAVDD